MGVFDEAELAKLDYFIDIAAKQGIYVIFPFIHGFMITQPSVPYYHPRGVEGLIKDQQLNQAFKHHIEVLLNRKNTINGKLYREDPTILGWEIIEDPIPNPADYHGEVARITVQEFHDWLDGMASYVKSVDSRHLVGIMAVGSISILAGNEWPKMLDATNIDFIEAEDEDIRFKNTYGSGWSLRLLQLKKPFFVMTQFLYLGKTRDEVCYDYPWMANYLKTVFAQYLEVGAGGVSIFYWASDLYPYLPDFDPCFNITDSIEPVDKVLLETSSELNALGYPFPPLDFVSVSH